MKLRSDLWNRLDYFVRPLKDDLDVDLLTTLYRFGLLAEKRRKQFVQEIRAAVIEDADDSFLENKDIAAVLTQKERASILDDVANEVLNQIGAHVYRLQTDWEADYDPDDYFDAFRRSIRRFTDALSGRVDVQNLRRSTEQTIRSAVEKMAEQYVPDTHTPAPAQQSAARADSLDELFRDVDE